MKGQKRIPWLPVAVLILISLAVSSCDGPATAEPASVECSGDVFVESETVTRVTPAPDVTYADGTTHTWNSPPYGVEVTGSGEAVLRVYYGNSLLSEYRAYAAGVDGHAQFTVEKWNGSKDVTMNVGNYVITDTDAGNVCDLNVSAGQVGISAVGTKYVVTVRPEINQVIVGVLDGVVEVTSQGRTVTLDAKVPTEALVAVTDGIIGPLLPIPDPGRLLDEVTNGQDIPLEPQDSGFPQETGSLTLWVDDRLLPVLQEIGGIFKNDTGIEVLIEGMPLSEIRDRYLAALESGNAPDMVTLQHQDTYELTAGGLALPLEMAIDPELLVPGTVQAFSYKGELYGVPYAYDNLALVSNGEYVPEVPPTWSELLSYAAELASGREFFTSLMIPDDGYHFYPIQSAFGGYIFGTSRDGTFDPQDLGMISDGSLSAAAWLEKMVDTQPVFLGSEEEALQNFQDWNAAMIVTGPWQLQRLRQMDIIVQIHSFPREVQESQPFLSAYGFMISRNSRSQEAALNLLWNYLTTYQAVQAYSDILVIPPARMDVLDNLEDEDVRAFGIAGVNGVPIPYIPEMNAVWGPWSDAIRMIISGETSGYEAFRNAYDIILKDLGQ
jgi:arabinogalactan oligomer/maltooligosaccharide transport system substrate-binding protein